MHRCGVPTTLEPGVDVTLAISDSGSAVLASRAGVGARRGRSLPRAAVLDLECPRAACTGDTGQPLM